MEKSTENIETPIPIIHNQIIELTEIVVYKLEGSVELHKNAFFLADITTVAERKKKDAKGEYKTVCRIYFQDHSTITVKEKYKKVYETWTTWLGHNRDRLEEIKQQSQAE